MEESLSKWMYLSNKKSCVAHKTGQALQQGSLLRRYLHLIMLSFASVFPKRFFGAVYTTRYGRIRSVFLFRPTSLLCAVVKSSAANPTGEKKKAVSQLALANIDYC